MSQSIRESKDLMAQFGIDTLRVARDLEAAGAERKQAEAIAAALNDSAAASYRNLATKNDLEKLEMWMKTTAATKDDLHRLELGMAALKSEFSRSLWIQGGAIVTILGGMTALFG